MLDNVRLIHMMGRVLDPKLGRFLSADPDRLFLSKVFITLKRAIRSVGSFGRRLVRNWGRQINAAIARLILMRQFNEDLYFVTSTS